MHELILSYPILSYPILSCLDSVPQKLYHMDKTAFTDQGILQNIV
jgi:hypothetical protein